MITNNKILTVSYGTFSCTLEGFDDSFGTMKAIAEYFRDLAADDRYFGAEPPQPDVDMLARIAQKEISRRVEAREHEGKIVLSALEEQADSAPSAAVASAAAPVAAAASALMQPADTPAEAAPAVEDVAASTETDTAELESTAPEAEAVAEPAPAQEEETVEAAQADEAEAEDLAELETDTVDEPVAEEEVAEVEEDVAEAAPEEAPAAEYIEDENDIVPGQPDAEVEAFFASSPTGTDQNDFEEIAELPTEAVDPVEPATDAGTTSIAAKLQRIRAVVAQQDDDVEDEAEYSEDDHADTDETLADLTAEEFDADEAVEAQEDAVTEETYDFDDVEETESFDAEAEDDDLDSDLELADASADDLETAEDDAAEVIEDVLDPSEAAEEDDIAAILSRLDAAEAAEAASEDEADEADMLLDDDQDEADSEELLENLFDAESDETVEATQAEAPAEEASDEPDVATYAASENQRIDVKAPKTPAQEALADAAEAMAARSPRARVIKVKRVDLEAAINRGDLEEVGDQSPSRPKLDPNHTAPGKFGTSSLSPEDEAELARELAALEADIAMDETEEAVETPADDQSEAMTLTEDMRAEDDWTADDEDHATAETFDEADESDVEAQLEGEDDAPSASRRDALPSLDAEQGGDMSRLLAEADQQMGEPESATRRDAFAHLRAAVAAKKADDALGHGSDTVKGDDAYRNDLADVVRPRRPDRSGAKTPRPGDGGPAPLKLVAEQRIDADNPTPAGPVRPRRVEAVDDNPALEGESFADFAHEMGATTLPQQLEAAAAYMSFVEGREQFSRPQLMTKVRQVNAQDGFSREDGLRHFGQLLRAGKIEKVKGGRFTVSEDIGFRPDHRAAS